ncbi:MAG: Fe-S cluster assembly protein SufD [Verrucomicrobia bacterium]|nr:Fe-S cluster assembly protein SufD [Verrucomicrobiota bacterium]
MMENGPYLEKFERFEKGAKGPAWVLAARKAGISHFTELGFPTLQDEDWRFTNVAPIAKRPFEPVVEPTRDAVAAKALNQFTFAGLSGSRIVFVNGHFAPELSSVAKLADGVKVMSLAGALASDTALVEKHLFRHARADANAFTALNTAFFQDGAFICVPAGKAVAEPIQILYVSTAKDNGTTAHPRNLIVAERGSQVTIVESYASLRDAADFTNSVTELVAGDNAAVEHLKFQDESQQAFHIATVAAHFGRASNVVTHSIALGAKLSRTNIYATLAGEGLECILNGLYLTRGEQLADHYMIVEHAQPHGASHEYFNGILADKSKGVFHGRILVRPGAQKTDAKQTNKNLLLSDDATANTKPQLEIYADDVKCTHGATIGQLDDESIFYLRTRGIALEKARRMLIHAFAGEIIDRIRCEPVREELDKLVWERLEQNEQVALNP